MALYLKACDFGDWCNGGEDYAVMNSNWRRLKGQFNGAGLNLTQYKITAIGIYGEYKRTTTYLYPMGNTNRGATLYNGSSISNMGSAISSQEDGDSKLSNSYASFTNYYTSDANIINQLVNQINSGLCVTIDLHADNTGGNSNFHMYGRNIRLEVSYTEKPKYTISLSAGAGGELDTYGGTYYEGQVFYVEAIPGNGYEFSGWSDGSTNNPRKITVAKNLSLTANFKPLHCTVTVKSNNDSYGRVWGGGTVDYGGYTTIYAEAYEGYRIAGWDDTLSAPADPTFDSRTQWVYGDITYTAIFEPVYVTYDTVFSYRKWFESGIVVSNGVLSDSNIMLFKITSNPNVGEATASSPYFPVKAGESYKIDISISGSNWDVYIFFCDENGTWINFNDSTNRFSHDMSGVASRIFTAPEGSVKAYIRCDANSSNNTVQFSDFRIYPADYEYMSNSLLFTDRTDIASWSIPTPEREGYTFRGWNTEPDGIGLYYSDSSRFPINDLTLYSCWERTTHSVTFKDDNGTVLKTVTVNSGSTVSPPTDPVKPDTAQHKYTFDGWYDANGNKWYPNTAITSDKVYTARFDSTVQRYTVKWYNEDGSVLLETDESVPYGTRPEYNSATPTKAETAAETYEHIGWSIDVTSSGTTELTTVVESVSYYARFRAISKGYTVIWRNDDGTVLETDTLVPYGTIPDYNGPTPTKDDEQFDYTFLGWSANVEDPPLDDTELPTVTGNITYTAVYEKTPKHFMVFVDFLNNKGELLGGYMKISEYGREIGIEADEIEGYRFIKWSDGNTDNPRNIIVTTEVEYEAIYERIPIPIIVNEDQWVTGVYIIPSTQTIVYVISGEVSAVVDDEVTVDNWNFKVSNSAPDNSYLIEKLYINEIRVY